ncbi:unnamed protein product [Porites lobata]|uniref:Secreted protein n=1 Tax=Porites lobata TaxID=104759 RepID=A0ABN8R5B2_9CNID|nr:unnamed protein product [Porites lobata]
MWCFLLGTSLLRQTLLPHCEQVTIHGVTFRMPSWALLRDLAELFPLGGLCHLADKGKSLRFSGVTSSGAHFSSYRPTILSNFLDPASFSHPFRQHCTPPINRPCIKTQQLPSKQDIEAYILKNKFL